MEPKIELKVSEYLTDPLALAVLFHATYERLAPNSGYETRKETRIFDPESSNGKLMLATCAQVQKAILSERVPNSPVAPLELLTTLNHVRADIQAVMDRQPLQKSNIELTHIYAYVGGAISRAGSPAPTPPQRVWFHGTSPEKASLIEKDGFAEGTWFAAHMEDAVAFGGPCVFFVKVTFESEPADKWQVCCSNALPASTIEKRWDFTRADGNGREANHKKANEQSAVCPNETPSKTPCTSSSPCGEIVANDICQNCGEAMVGICDMNTTGPIKVASHLKDSECVNWQPVKCLGCGSEMVVEIAVRSPSDPTITGETDSKVHHVSCCAKPEIVDKGVCDHLTIPHENLVCLLPDSWHATIRVCLGCGREEPV